MNFKKTIPPDEDIPKAVEEWCDPETRAYAEEEYGHIVFWDTSGVTSMRKLFSATRWSDGSGIGEAAK